MFKKSFILLFLTLYITVFSQNKNATAVSVVVDARAQKDKILLRWTINNPIEWKKAHQKGFTVVRFTIKRDGKLLEQPEKLLLTPQPLVPAPLNDWMKIIQEDNNAAIIAQAIYGDSFLVTGKKESASSKIISVADELSQRYTFALYAADLSFEGAKMAGWALADQQVKNNEIYVYQVSVFGNDKIKNAAYSIGLKDFEPLPAPIDFMAVGDDKKVILSWDYSISKKIYTAFMIEKSENGVDFLPISKSLITNLNDNEKKPLNTMYYIDTIQNNQKTYHYRLCGVSAFSEKGLYTKTVSVQGVESLYEAPYIKNYSIEPDNSVQLEWEYQSETKNNTAYFEVNVSDKNIGNYKVVSEKLPPNTRKFHYKNSVSANYFTVTAVGKNQKRFTSKSVFVQTIDSIAPAIPIELEGEIDKLGVVKLKWTPNTEKDLLGYRILKANSDKEEFIDIYQKPYTKNTFEDKANLKLTNKKVYYRIAAEDVRHNISKPSEILVLTKPDALPPSAPIFKNYDSEKGKINLEWIRSYSDDVSYHLLRKRLLGTEKWEDVLQVRDTVQQKFTDDKVEKNKTYQYAIVARDKNGLWSDIENSVITVKALDFTPSKSIRFFDVVLNRENKSVELQWDFVEKENVMGLSIYKNEVGKTPVLWRELPGNITKITDANLSINTEFEYHISVLLKNNLPTKTEKVIVKF